MDSDGLEKVKYLHGERLKLRERIANITARMKDRTEGITKKAVATVEVVAAAGIGGLIQGHAGPKGLSVMGVPTDALLGLALNAAGYFNLAGKQYSEHLNNFGDGFLASFASSVGWGWGHHWHETGKFSFTGLHEEHPSLPPGTTASGNLSPGHMADIVSRVHAAAARSPV